ncbi:EfeM/EfeO family lipoprotein [Luteipulveratus mongoliensis]|uniref:EfeM/EfeO family lipoprotein n=1 Tax=Luteipulveratus mongoliensis TaxID=571913 RepID=UPI00146FEE31|nr:imelysin family protein [Luteipulveratus mongoliensis]
MSRLVAVLAGVVLLLTGCSSGTSSARSTHVSAGRRSSSSRTVQVSLSHCGEGWSPSQAGPTLLHVRNTDTRAGEVYLTRARTDQVVAVLDPLGPGAEGDMSVALGSGSYTVVCSMEDADPVRGPPTTVTGTAAGSPAVAAVTQTDLIAPTKRYHDIVAGRLRTLVGQTRTLDHDITTGNRAAAQRDWLTAHLAYESLGAAYGAFGDADGAINGRPDGLPQGISDPDFTGFHRIEQLLWHNGAMPSIGPFSHRLLGDVTTLSSSFGTAQIDPHETVIRAHEITENTLQVELTGSSDLGSGSSLATADANLTGTQLVLGQLDGLLRPRYPSTSLVSARIVRAQKDLRALLRGGRYPSLGRLTRPQRERINGDFAELTELLAPVATILEPRRV